MAKTKISWAKGSAATDWFPYNPNPQSLLHPQIGEWCLWSTIIRGERSYFSGSLFYSNDKIMVSADGWGAFELEDAYWAKVRYIVDTERQND